MNHQKYWEMVDAASERARAAALRSGLVFASRLTDDAPKAPGKAAKPRIEDALTRGLKRCHEVDARFERATVRFQDPEGVKEKNLLLMLEFGDGRVAMFTGGVDPEHDQFLVVEAELLETLDEVVTRARKRK